MAGSTCGFQTFATSESPASLLRTQVPGPLPQIREVWVEPENSSKLPGDGDAAGGTTL